MNKAEAAVVNHQNGMNCAQAVLVVYAEELGYSREVALKIAAGFGGGMGRMGETCGAVTGAFMAIGLQFGSTETTPEVKDTIAERIRECAQQFTARNSSLTCRGLLGYEIGTPDGRKAIKENHLSETVCMKAIRDVVEIIEALKE